VGARRLLISDIDGTLLGDPAALSRFGEWLADRRRSWLLAYASGRHLAAIRAAMEAEGLPAADALITMVGTEVLDAAGRPWPGWRERFADFEGERIRAHLRRFEWLELQPDEWQSQLKASYFVDRLVPARRVAVERLLENAGMDVRLILSGGRQLDVIPGRAGKGHAARFLAGCLGLPDDDVLVFGDSGNDLELLAEGFRGTIVANAEPELRAAVGSGVYHAQQPFADGVLDGIAFWSRVTSGNDAGTRRS
jgi:sucrose-6F-phosphate phosphohydrolase